MEKNILKFFKDTIIKMKEISQKKWMDHIKLNWGGGEKYTFSRLGATENAPLFVFVFLTFQFKKKKKK